MKNPLNNRAWRNLVTRVSLLALAVGLALPALASSWKNALKESLEAQYPLTKRATFSQDRITKEGVVLVIEKPGITANLSSDMRYSLTYVKDGQISEQGGAMVAFFGKKNARVFKRGDKVYVTGIKVGGDYVMFELLSRSMFGVEKNGSTKQTRYAAALSFKFAKTALPTMTPAQVEATISHVLATETQYAALNTKTISLGQTIAQVKAILGPPGRVVNLGPKVIYIYKDMKVIFMNGKVSDVE